VLYTDTKLAIFKLLFILLLKYAIWFQFSKSLFFIRDRFMKKKNLHLKTVIPFYGGTESLGFEIKNNERIFFKKCRVEHTFSKRPASLSSMSFAFSTNAFCSVRTCPTWWLEKARNVNNYDFQVFKILICTNLVVFWESVRVVILALSSSTDSQFSSHWLLLT